MNTWTVKKRIAIGFLVLITLMAAVGGVGVYSLYSVDKLSERLVERDMPGALIMAGIKDNISQAYGYIERMQRQTDIEDMRDSEAKYEKLYQQNVALFAEYEKTLDSAEGRQLLAKLNHVSESYGEVRRTLFDIALSGDKERALAYMNQDFLPEYRNYRAALQSCVEWNRANSIAAGSSVGLRVKASISFIMGFLFISIVVSLVSAIVIITKTNGVLNRAIQNLTEGSSQLAAASAEVSSASNSLAQGASQQAASLEETSSSLEEMSSMTANNAESARHARELSEQVRLAADESAEQMQHMQQAMDAIKDSSEGISQIIKTIDEIAFQTNILALNAAVEAARAGEAGAGFAIVANEVRNLAQRSATSAKETSEKIQGAVNSSVQGVQISAKVAGSLGAIVEKARSMHTVVSEIAQATEEQSKGISQLSYAVADIDKVTQSNASNAEETAAASEQLNANADSLNDTVGELLSLVQKSLRSSAQNAMSRHLLVGVGEAEPEAEHHWENPYEPGFLDHGERKEKKDKGRHLLMHDSSDSDRLFGSDR